MAPPRVPQTPTIDWNSPRGHDEIQKIVKKCLPQWTEGAKAWQLPIVARTLQGASSINVAATGDGKSALYFLPVLIKKHLEASSGPITPANQPRPPVAVIVLPFDSIANSLVSQH